MGVRCVCGGGGGVASIKQQYAIIFVMKKRY